MSGFIVGCLRRENALDNIKTPDLAQKVPKAGKPPLQVMTVSLFNSCHVLIKGSYFQILRRLALALYSAKSICLSLKENKNLLWSTI